MFSWALVTRTSAHVPSVKIRIFLKIHFFSPHLPLSPCDLLSSRVNIVICRVTWSKYGLLIGPNGWPSKGLSTISLSTILIEILQSDWSRAVTWAKSDLLIGPVPYKSRLLLPSWVSRPPSVAHNDAGNIKGQTLKFKNNTFFTEAKTLRLCFAQL